MQHTDDAWVDRVLVVDDEEDIRELCAEALTDAGFWVATAASVPEAVTTLENEQFDFVLTDVRMPEANGIDLLRAIRETNPDVDVIVMTGYATVSTAVECLKLGAYDYLTKPFALEDLVHRVRQLAARRGLASENRVLRGLAESNQGPGGIVGRSAKMREIYKLISRLAGRRHPVLIIGESGTGKELVARALHDLGPNPAEPFLPVDCGALSATLMESELFGHRQGAFTGASQNRPGMLAAARHGTIFLDEIGELPLDLQAKLLRVLQEHEYRQVGSNNPQRFEARVVAATNRDLARAIKDGTFRSDLYYRLNVLAVNVPPLRERKEDIPALVQFFIDRERTESNSDVIGISSAALEKLQQYDWPGNVRELQNHIHRALVIATGPAIREQDLAGEIAVAGMPGVAAEVPAPAAPRSESLEEIERSAILAMLEATGGHRLKAAQRLGIGKTTMYKKLKQYGLEV